MHHIVDHEKWSTKTKLNISFGTKLTLALFCNTALITLAVEIITFGNYYGVGGMITTESMVKNIIIYINATFKGGGIL